MEDVGCLNGGYVEWKEDEINSCPLEYDQCFIGGGGREGVAGA